MPTESMDIVQSLWAPWTLSRVSMDIVLNSTDSMDNVKVVHEFSGHFTDR